MEELKRRAEQLDSDVRELTDTTHANTAALDRVNERLDRSDRDRKWMVAAIIGALLVVCAVAFVAVRAEQTGRAQAELQSQVLCPLYGIFIGSYDPSSRPEGEARTKYEDAYAQIRHGWEFMRCTGTTPIVPPRTN